MTDNGNPAKHKKYQCKIFGNMLLHFFHIAATQ